MTARIDIYFTNIFLYFSYIFSLTHCIYIFLDSLHLYFPRHISSFHLYFPLLISFIFSFTHFFLLRCWISYWFPSRFPWCHQHESLYRIHESWCRISYTGYRNSSYRCISPCPSITHASVNCQRNSPGNFYYVWITHVICNSYIFEKLCTFYVIHTFIFFSHIQVNFLFI